MFGFKLETFKISNIIKILDILKFHTPCIIENQIKWVYTNKTNLLNLSIFLLSFEVSFFYFFNIFWFQNVENYMLIKFKISILIYISIFKFYRYIDKYFINISMYFMNFTDISDNLMKEKEIHGIRCSWLAFLGWLIKSRGCFINTQHNC